uniref:Uncharacterized protein n=1 Tax=Euglena viridis TaxID=3040 RepID=M1EUR0_EUGVI|nr:hypothetical protein I642_p059 [Euglena viridis]AEY70786.1 hypothetical protein [Euglena viridis]
MNNIYSKLIDLTKDQFKNKRIKINFILFFEELKRAIFENEFLIAYNYFKHNPRGFKVALSNKYKAYSKKNILNSLENNNKTVEIIDKTLTNNVQISQHLIIPMSNNIFENSLSTKIISENELESDLLGALHLLTVGKTYKWPKNSNKRGQTKIIPNYVTNKDFLCSWDLLLDVLQTGIRGLSDKPITKTEKVSLQRCLFKIIFPKITRYEKDGNISTSFNIRNAVSLLGLISITIEEDILGNLNSYFLGEKLLKGTTNIKFRFLEKKFPESYTPVPLFIKKHVVIFMKSEIDNTYTKAELKRVSESVARICHLLGYYRYMTKTTLGKIDYRNEPVRDLDFHTRYLVLLTGFSRIEGNKEKKNFIKIIYLIARFMTKKTGELYYSKVSLFLQLKMS